MLRDIHIPVVHVALNPDGKTGYVETLSAIVPPGLGQVTDHVSLMTSDKLLIKRAGGMGDVLMLTPTLRELHRKYAHLEIHVAVNSPFVSLIKTIPYIKVHRLEGLIEDDVSRPVPIFDLVVDLNTFVERSPRRKTVDRKILFAEAFGMALDDTRTEYRILPDDDEAASLWWDEHVDSERPAIALAPLATDPKRSWPPSHIREFTRLATDENVQIIWVHSDDRCRAPVNGISDDVIYADNLPIRQVAPILQRCHSLVSVDSGAYHLAAAVQRKGTTPGSARPYLFVLFGQIPPDLRMSGYSNYFTFYRGDLECTPCYSGPRQFNCKAECMSGILPDTVWKSVKAFGLR